MSNLAALVKTRRKKGIVAPRIDEYLFLTDMSEDRRDGFFHPSDLSNPHFCPRAWSLYNFHPEGFKVKEGAIEPRLARIFGNGHGVHTRIQRYFQGMGVLWGRWRRLVRVETDEQGEPVPVYEYTVGFPPRLKSGGIDWTWEYTEVRLYHEEDRILGSTDGKLWLDGRKYGLEIKSIKDEGFRWLQEDPKGAHRNQVFIYEHCDNWEHEQKDLHRAFVDGFDAEPLHGYVVLYENKNDQELKEYFVPNDRGLIEQFMDSRRKLMHRALEYERTKEHPECRCPPSRRNPLCEAFEDV